MKHILLTAWTAALVINGYNDKGEIITLEPLKIGESCNQIASEFKDQCYNAGFEIIYGKNCEVVCSGQTVIPEF